MGRICGKGPWALHQSVGLFTPSHNIHAFTRFSSATTFAQVDGFSGAFVRSYTDQASAKGAWKTYSQHGIFPDYGKGPWVVFLGRKLGVFESP
jgi:hypothetical protein